jgi:hypothetical protein
MWLTEQGEIVDGTIFKYVCDSHTANVAYGYRSFLKTKKKTKVLKQLEKNGRVQLDEFTTGSYYKCVVDQHQTTSVCLDGDAGWGTDEFCGEAKKRKKLLLYKNVIKKFNKNYEKFVKDSADDMTTCGDKLPGDWHDRFYEYTHTQLSAYKKQYGNTVARDANFVAQAFPKQSKKKNAVQKPTCQVKGAGTLNKQKKPFKKATKFLAKTLEKSPNFCS